MSRLFLPFHQAAERAVVLRRIEGIIISPNVGISATGCDLQPVSHWCWHSIPEDTNFTALGNTHTLGSDSSEFQAHIAFSFLLECLMGNSNSTCHPLLMIPFHLSPSLVQAKQSPSILLLSSILSFLFSSTFSSDPWASTIKETSKMCLNSVFFSKSITTTPCTRPIIPNLNLRSSLLVMFHSYFPKKLQWSPNIKMIMLFSHLICFSGFPST